MRTCSKEGCIYPVFGSDRRTGIGYCNSHQYLRTDLDRRSIQQKAMAKAKVFSHGTVSSGNKVQVNEKEQTNTIGKEPTELQKWYSGIMESESGKCWETGASINKNDKRGWHGSICHVLPKSLFPSVATHPMNYMILKMWGGTHGQYDSSWENAAKMKIWTYACKIFNILYPLLTREEKSKLPDIILQEIKPEIYNAKNRSLNPDKI